VDTKSIYQNKDLTVFLDTDVIINWLCKEVDINTGERLWAAPHEIMKLIKDKRIYGASSLLNFMEIVFVLRRKNICEDKEILYILSKIASMPTFLVIVPRSEDVVFGYHSEIERSFNPLKSFYFGICLNHDIDFILTRDADFRDSANIDKEIALTPEEFLEKLQILNDEIKIK